METTLRAPQPLNPTLDMTEYELRRRINDADARFRRGTDVDLKQMSLTLSTHDFADYLSLCRMLRMKTRSAKP